MRAAVAFQVSVTSPLSTNGTQDQGRCDVRDKRPRRDGAAGGPGQGGVMRVWLWDAGDRLGVTDDEERARAVAASCIPSAGTARVELARLVTITADGFQPAYQRSGIGQAGRRTGNQVTWTPLCREAATA